MSVQLENIRHPLFVFHVDLVIIQMQVLNRALLVLQVLYINKERHGRRDIRWSYIYKQDHQVTIMKEGNQHVISVWQGIIHPVKGQHAKNALLVQLQHLQDSLIALYVLQVLNINIRQYDVIIINYYRTFNNWHRSYKLHKMYCRYIFRNLWMHTMCCWILFWC